MPLSPEQLRHAFYRMALIRAFETRVHEEMAAGTVPGFAHLYSGQEAVAVGVCENLTEADAVTSTHRGHGHALAKGCSPERVMAEIYGRRDGLCQGKGGSMHLASVAQGFLGANGIVGAGAPIATGAALAHRIRGQTHVAVCFAGEGASNQGAVFESLNLAVVLRLPVIFVFESNGFAQFTSGRYGIGSGDLLARATAFGLPGVRVDGTDFFSVYEAAADAVGRARAGEGPSVIDAEVPRFFGHFEGDPELYRQRGEVQAARRERDCLQRFRSRVTRDRLMDETELDALEAEAARMVERATEFAKSSAPAEGERDLLADVYVSYS